MLKSLMLGQLHSVDSPLRRLTAISKLAATMLLIISTVVSADWTDLALIAGVLLVLSIIGRLPLSYYAGNLLWLLVTVTLVIASYVFAYQSNAWFGGETPLPVVLGASRGILVAAKVVLIFAAVSVLVLTTAPLAMSRGIATLLSPLARFGFPTEDVNLVTAVSLSSLSLLMEDVRRIADGHQMRSGSYLRRNVLDQAELFYSILVAVIVTTLRRADDLTVAMEIRCYRPGSRRTALHRNSFSLRDALLLIATGTTLVLVLWL